jgi:hypothetical protein
MTQDGPVLGLLTSPIKFSEVSMLRLFDYCGFVEWKQGEGLRICDGGVGMSVWRWEIGDFVVGMAVRVMAVWCFRR